MEAFLEINYELVFQRRKGHIFSYHVPKRPKVLKKLTFDISKFKFQNGLEQKTSKKNFFFRQTGLKKGMQILLQILKPLSDTEILTLELVGDQIEMVA